MKTDVVIAQEAKMKPIMDIAKHLGLTKIEPYGKYKAKIALEELERLECNADGKLILVTAINPTPAGEGKTTTNVGLSMGLNRIGKRACTTLREPSLGPVFGVKGGAAGGGYAQVVPMEDINLHFTGDFHAITSAHNLLAALLDNHIQHGNALDIDPKRIVWRRAIDMNDRALRNVVIGLGSRGDGVAREAGFDITVASEVMAILCLASGMEDLKARLSRMVIAYKRSGVAITAKDLDATGAMALLLKDAIKPNLVQTLENTPAFIHGGPFANIAHGCNSVMATKAALKLSDYVVTEAGFGSDLGAEKFFNIKCRYAGLEPAAVVIVATVKALKYNGGGVDLTVEDLGALRDGIANLERHIENIAKFGVPAVVAINRFPSDTEEELKFLDTRCKERGVEVVLSEVFARGGNGGVELAKKVVEICDMKKSEFKPLYELDLPIDEKIELIAKEIYRAEGVDFTAQAQEQMEDIANNGFSDLPICMAKTQFSFTDDQARLGAPDGFRITVRELRVSAGAGFIVALTGEIMTLPGLPKVPAAKEMDIGTDGVITGLS